MVTALHCAVDDFMKEFELEWKKTLLTNTSNRRGPEFSMSNDLLKNISQIEHTRHRSPANFLINLLSGLISYQCKEKKPSINLDCLHKNMIKAA